MLKQSAYEILGLNGEFEYKDIKKAYRMAIRNNPPDQNPDQFAKISDAYDILTKEEYFFQSVKDNLFTKNIDIELNTKDKKAFDNKEYLKKIFEIPFIS